MVGGHGMFTTVLNFPAQSDRNQVWGFQEIGGERRYVRHILLVGLKGERIEAVVVLDYRQLPHQLHFYPTLMSQFSRTAEHLKCLECYSSGKLAPRIRISFSSGR